LNTTIAFAPTGTGVVAKRFRVHRLADPWHRGRLRLRAVASILVGNMARFSIRDRISDLGNRISGSCCFRLLRTCAERTILILAGNAVSGSYRTALRTGVQRRGLGQHLVADRGGRRNGPLAAGCVSRAACTAPASCSRAWSSRRTAGEAPGFGFHRSLRGLRLCPVLLECANPIRAVGILAASS